MSAYLQKLHRKCMCLLLPLLKVSIDDSAGEALSADPNTLQHTITPQLVDNQEVLHQTWMKH